MLGPCRRHRSAVAALVELPATLSADSTASDVYGTARAAIAVVLCAIRQMPHRLTVMLADTLIAVVVMAGFGLIAAAAALAMLAVAL
jgi:hypothetical protein